MDIRGNRKLAVALLAMLSVSVLVGMRLIADGVYATVMVAAIGGYLTANVVQKGVTSGSD